LLVVIYSYTMTVVKMLSALLTPFALTYAQEVCPCTWHEGRKKLKLPLHAFSTML